MTARPLYPRCTELDTDNSYDENDLEKGGGLHRLNVAAMGKIQYMFASSAVLTALYASGKAWLLPGFWQ